jgi:hypothetical protein
MTERKATAKTTRGRRAQIAEDELAKFVRNETAFQQADREERAIERGLPVSIKKRLAARNRTRK